jgi:cytochrome c oxidase subunit 4
MSEHIVAKKTYFFVFLVLIALTIATTEAAKIDLGPLNVFVALVIAGTKMMLVVLFFMHIKWSSHRIKVVPAAGLLWLWILIVLTLADYFTRRWLPIPGGW